MRNFIPLIAAIGIGLLANTLAAQTRPEPVLYDLVIDGESFTVEINRSLKLPSKKKPGVTYEIALRVAPAQRLVLNRLQLDYDRGYEATDDSGKNVRTATLNHELGYTMVVSDVGGAMDETNRRQMLSTLQASMEKSFREKKAEGLKTAPRHERRFQHVPAEGVTIQYHDSQGRANTCLVYVLAGKDFTATAIVQFKDDDHENVLPLVKKTLDSLRGSGLQPDE